MAKPLPRIERAFEERKRSNVNRFVRTITITSILLARYFVSQVGDVKSLVSQLK